MSDSTLTQPFSKVLVANRGEIAVRVMRTLREMGLRSVAVFSEADRAAFHVRYADEAHCIGPPPSTESYLRIDKLIEVARQCGAEAVHPGYGFLSERAGFARAVTEAGLVWIGPPPGAIEAMGEKVRARQLMADAGVPLIPGTKEAIEDVEEARQIATEIGFPVLIKASAGGGGKGMRLVERPADFVEAFHSASREALSAFGSGDCYIEKFLINPRHVEFQVLGDTHGNVVHLFERDCSVQRRHQKVIEETPCPVLRHSVRERMGAVAVRAAQAVGYYNAGTIELLLDSDHESFYFLEMNTRLQVEHPITEWVTGLDLVELQIRVARGEALPFEQGEVTARGAAIEARVYAEDPANKFLPSPGMVRQYSVPEGPGVRVDSGIYEGFEVAPFYDPLMLKLTVWGHDRAHALRRMRRALGELHIGGLRDNAAFLRRVMEHPDFVSGDYDIGFVDRQLEALLARPQDDGQLSRIAELAGLVAAYDRDEARRRGLDGSAPPKERVVSLWRQMGRWRQIRNH